MLLVHILRDGDVLVPPFPAPKIPKLLHASSILPTDHFWHEGMTAWQLVSTRWEADDGSSAASPGTAGAVLPAPGGDTNLANEINAPRAVSRRNRPSLLDECKKRYYETFAPWAKDDAAP